MAKKRVILEPQERFDLIDAHALQTLTYSYMAEAFGGIMGWGAGMLTPLPLAVFPNAAANDPTITFNGVFAFYQTKTAPEEGTTGEVVVFNPANTAQSVTTLDFSALLAAANVYYAANPGEGVSRYDGPNPLGQGAFPILWARSQTSEGSQDARRKWSVALQVEVPVTINTREQTFVEFAFADNMTGPVADGNGLWAPIAKIVGWQQDGGVTYAPTLQEISVWDNLEWFRKTRQAGVDLDGDAAFDDFWSNTSANIAAGRTMHQRTLSGSPWASIWYEMYRHEAFAQRNEASLGEWLDAVHTVEGLDPQHDLFPFTEQPCPGATFSGNFTGTGGIVDLFNHIRAAIKNLVRGGIRDYPHEAGADDDAHPFAALVYSGRSGRGEHLPNSFAGNTRKNNMNAALYAHGDPDAGWDARPLRSINTLTIEQSVQNDSIKVLEDDLTAAEALIAALTDRVDDLENAGNPFENVPINDAQALVPLAVVNYTPDYFRDHGQMKFKCGPPGAVREVRFFVRNQMPGSHNQAYGGVEVTIARQYLEGLGFDNGNLLLGDCPIVVTPLHFAGKGHWLLPERPVLAGIIQPVANENFDNEPRGFHRTLMQDSQRKNFGNMQGGGQIEAQFANFYQCTLNTIIVQSERGNDVVIRICPVSTVPDLVGSTEFLRGYPHVNALMCYKHDPDDGDSWGQTDQVEGTWRQMLIDGRDHGRLIGDVTNPLVQLRAAMTQDRITQRHFLMNAEGAANVAQGGEPGQSVLGSTHTNVQSGIHQGHGVPAEPSPTIFGTQISGGRIRNDDLRGPAPRMTFIRPDRFHFTVPDGRADFDPAHKEWFNNSAGNTQNDTRYDEPNVFKERDGFFLGQDDTPESVASRLKASGGQGCTLMNGRFMPGFSLIVYKPTFAVLGGAGGGNSQDIAGDRYISPGIRFQNGQGEVLGAGVEQGATEQSCFEFVADYSFDRYGAKPDDAQYRVTTKTNSAGIGNDTDLEHDQKALIVYEK